MPVAIASLPFDTTLYDAFPISAFIFEALPDDGRPRDYRIVYGNPRFARDWRAFYQNDHFPGALLRRDRVIDGETLDRINAFMEGRETPHAFSTHLTALNLYVRFEPMTTLEPPYMGFFTINITEDEEKESRLHFLRNIRQMNNMAVLMRRHDDDRLEALYVSESFARMMECDEAEALAHMDGIGFFRSTVPEDRPLVRSVLKRRVAEDGGSTLTIQKITARGHRRWCNVHYSFIDDFHEHYVYCTYSDITVLKQYEERLKSVYVSLGSNFYRTNEQTMGLLRVNLTQDEIEEVKGDDLFPTDSAEYPYSEAMRMRVRYFPIPAEQALFAETFDRERLSEGYLKGIVTTSQVLYSRRADGRTCFVRFTATLTRHPMSGDIIAFITEQECNSDKVQEVLREKILVQQFDMVSYLVDGRYGVTIGDAAQIRHGSLFPTTRSGNYAQYLKNQVLPVLSGTEEQKAAAAEALSLGSIERELAVKEPYVVNIACDIDGDTYYKRFDFYSVDPDAKFYILLKSDTTEIQKETMQRNAQLRDALAEAEQASVAKTAFLSSMSHEIRTPMNAIIGLDGIALQDKNLSPQTREHLEKIGLSAHHLLELINDILDMSRIESGRMTLKNEEFSFRTFLEQINTLVDSQCRDRGLRYECDVRGLVDDYYIGDAMKLKQVLINILGNAVKFTPAPGLVSLIVERAAQFGEQTTLRFVVKDTGIGMDADYLPRIFDVFSQEDATRTSSYGGSGLGMAITKSLVEMMNGDIAVASQKGKGSEFTVTVTLRNALERREEQPLEINTQELRVLVVDDDPVACRHAALILEELGVASDVCRSGAEALEMVQLRHARRETYNVILVDLRMPEMDGMEVTRGIRRILGPDSCVIILTAYSWADVEAEAMEAGVDSFMAKPLYADSFMAELQQAFRRKGLADRSEKKKAALEGRRVLLAEDVPTNAEIMKQILIMREMEVEHAENGQLAVELFESHPVNYFDAVLMDVRMPVMDGLAATQAIRALDRPDARTVPIIAMTANAFDEDVQRSLQAGMDAHLSKPVEIDRLYETLEELIRP